MNKIFFVIICFWILLPTQLTAQDKEIGAGLNALIPMGKFGQNNFSVGGGLHVDFLMPLPSHTNLVFGVIYSYNVLSQHAQNFREDINVQINSRYNEAWPVDMRLNTTNGIHQVLLTSKYYFSSRSVRPFVQLMGGVPWITTRTTFTNRSAGPLEEVSVSGMTHQRSILLGGGVAAGLQLIFGQHSLRFSGSYMATTQADYLTKNQIRSFEYQHAPSVSTAFDFENPQHFNFEQTDLQVRSHALQFLEFRVSYIFLF